MPTISICTLIAEQYRTGDYEPGQIRRYFGTLAAYYAQLAASADVRITLPELEERELAIYVGSAVALVSLAVEHPTWRRALAQAIPDLVTLLDTLEAAEQAGRAVPAPPSCTMERDASGRLVVRSPVQTSRPADGDASPPVPWERAGGPDECPHGYAAGVPCPTCGPRV